jgi:hypothetical protein
VSKYTGIQKEETLKALIFEDYFGKNLFGYEPNIDNIDFVITDKKTRGDLFSGEGSGASVHYLWAEAKKGIVDVFVMFTQLLLTCKKTYDKGVYLAPPYIGCFDTAHIAFAEFSDILPIFSANDFNWLVTPSNHETPDFQKALKLVKDMLGAKIAIYNLGGDDTEIRDFIRNNFITGKKGSGGIHAVKTPITKDNFVQIFAKWVREVKPSINISKEKWLEYKQKGVLESDFFRADMLSKDGCSITDKLKTQNIREHRGSYFTPSIWVKKSHEYFARILGENWQNEYHIWDCAAGTGNLLAGLENPYNVWASDIDDTNIATMQALSEIDENLDLISAHIFQFDFLNDDFSQLPEELQKIINNPEKRKKLVLYINPPYAEVSSLGATETKGRKAGVNESKAHTRYAGYLGTAGREIFALFLARMYFEIPDCVIGEFSTLKMFNGSAFVQFRDFFKAKLEKCFIVPANTFDNVHGQFPIGFKIWNTSIKEPLGVITADVFNEKNEAMGAKRYEAFTKGQFINKWITSFKGTGIGAMGYMDGINGNDFAHNNIVYITNTKNKLPNPRGIWIDEVNLSTCAVYFTVRHCIEHRWLNHNDQFLVPKQDWLFDFDFNNDCIIYTLFHGKNAVTCEAGINNWIPFSEKLSKSKEKYESNFMIKYLQSRKKLAPFTLEAQTVLDAGLALWQYYHKTIKNNNTASVNASFYDIRAFFQGRDGKGRMNNNSDDQVYNDLLVSLKEELKKLTEKIVPKVYGYGFLR